MELFKHLGENGMPDVCNMPFLVTDDLRHFILRRCDPYGENFSAN